jgi:hypothetical protein
MRGLVMTPEELQKIDAAIGAHSKWLLRLREAIRKKASDFDPKVVKADRSCDFGKWLYGDFPGNLKGGKEYEEIIKLHAKFHESAAQILQLAIDGKRDEAEKQLHTGGQFMGNSGTLIMKLRALQKANS